jgi:hypothetical protein
VQSDNGQAWRNTGTVALDATSLKFETHHHTALARAMFRKPDVRPAPVAVCSLVAGSIGIGWMMGIIDG